ncbi:Myeloid leukemia factor 1 [Spatholobus suberectus]|nr:Myeloid leukemia factor 1 [Spatholobus suberectus]
MQGRGGGRDPFFDFGDPFGGFGGFGSFGPPRSLISSFFGGRDPFDDPFFSRPFGGMFESSPFGGPTGSPFPPGMFPSGFLEHQAPGMHPSGFLERQAPEPSRQRGPIIQELDSDDENEDATKEKKGNPRKHSRSNEEPFVEHPDGEIEGKKSRHLQTGNEYNRFNATVPRPQSHSYTTVPQPQSHSFCFQSSTVSYGGPNGMYYTSSRTRRSGSDGVTFEESKEADSSKRQASHIISRGIHDKGHSLSRKLNSDGRVDTMQTLHNINEDELTGFEEEWKGKGQKYLPGWTGSIEAVRNNGQAEQARQGGWALPSSEHSHPVGTISEARDEVGSSRTQGRVRTNSSGRSAYRPGEGRGRN